MINDSSFNLLRASETNDFNIFNQFKSSCSLGQLNENLE